MESPCCMKTWQRCSTASGCPRCRLRRSSAPIPGRDWLASLLGRRPCSRGKTPAFTGVKQAVEPITSKHETISAAMAGQLIVFIIHKPKLLKQLAQPLRKIRDDAVHVRIDHRLQVGVFIDRPDVDQNTVCAHFFQLRLAPDCSLRVMVLPPKSSHLFVKILYI